METDVWILKYTYEDGSVVHAYGSHQKALDAIAAIVKEAWDEGYMDDVEYPGNPQTAVEMYFDYHNDTEWYSILKEVIDIPLDLPEEEVVLTPQELDVAQACLEIGGDVIHLSKVMFGKTDTASVAKTNELWESVYKKLA